MGGRSGGPPDPHARNEAVAPPELVIERRPDVQHQQADDDPRPHAVGDERRIAREIGQRALPRRRNSTGRAPDSSTRAMPLETITRMTM